MDERTAILMDGGFVKKKLCRKGVPKVKEVTDLAEAIMKKPQLAGANLFRIYFYDAPPFEGKSKHPLTGETINFSGSLAASQNQALLQSLELQPNFAVRRGVLTCSGWKLGPRALKSLSSGTRPMAASDLVPDIAQKGVDMRVGLDIAWLSLKRIVDSVVLVTGDSDFVPAMKFARREGVRVYLETMKHGVRVELKAHADIVL